VSRWDVQMRALRVHLRGTAVTLDMSSWALDYRPEARGDYVAEDWILKFDCD